jgi:hypothetical protein
VFFEITNTSPRTTPDTPLPSEALHPLSSNSKTTNQ